MDPYGDYAIYFIDIFGTFEATLIAYLLGVLVILILGLEGGFLMHRMTDPKRTFKTLKKLQEPEKEKMTLDEKNMDFVHTHPNLNKRQ